MDFRGMTVAAGVAVMMVSGVAAAETGVRPSIVVHVDDYVGVPAGAIQEAKAEVARALGSAGVNVEWAEGPLPIPTSTPALSSDDRHHLTVAIVNNQTLAGAKSAGPTDASLGQAFHVVGRAHVFYNRILDRTACTHVNANLVLAHVITHEIGHLLLGPNSHSPLGVMRPSLDAALGGFHRFTDEQAAAIRAGLAPL